MKGQLTGHAKGQPQDKPQDRQRTVKGSEMIGAIAIGGSLYLPRRLSSGGLTVRLPDADTAMRSWPACRDKEMTRGDQGHDVRGQSIFAGWTMDCGVLGGL